jgi:hypothetical protein
MLAWASVLLVIVASTTAFADSIAIGDLEFNSLFSGVNYFTISNFTGSNNPATKRKTCPRRSIMTSRSLCSAGIGKNE